jgi:4-alpha-glucanotransferase
MDISFKINYHTQWGEELWICGSVDALGNWDTEKALPMSYIANGEWESSTIIKKAKQFEYKYFLKTQNNSIVWEGRNNRVFNSFNQKNVVIRDFWRPQTDFNSVFYTKTYTSVLMKPESLKQKKNEIYKHTLLFRMHAPRVPRGKTLAITGNTKALGNWKRPVELSNANYPVWEKTINIEQFNQPIEYKYLIIDNKTKQIEQWEEGEERMIPLFNPAKSEILFIQNDESFRYKNQHWKGAGVAIPVFSLRSKESFGVGEFYDLKKLADWCSITGLKMIQVLPIYDTIATHKWIDSYPYKSITVLALHPMFLNIEGMGSIENEKTRDEFELAKEVLNSKHYSDYVEVNRLKLKYFKLLFNQNWDKLKKTKSYKEFLTNNKEWLEPYAAFSYLRDIHKTTNYKKWGKWSIYNPNEIEKLIAPKAKHHKQVAFYYYLQFHLDKQLKEAVAYAHEKGVAIKGDIPIGISPNSVEAWSEPEHFNLKSQAGAPPDDFAVLGQNWGFPTYNWELMEKDGFSWWKKRMSMMAKYFDAYRIDHILGFFRIWEIPLNAIHGLLGYFKPALPLNTNEIMDAGIWFDSDRFTKPYIRGHFLHDFFGEFTEEVRKKYLIETEQNTFILKEELNTQRKIYNYFTPDENTEENLNEKELIIRDGLMSLLDEVLFIKDPYTENASAYHPRIAFHYTYSYRELDHEIKAKLDALYIDFFYKRHEQFWKEQALDKLPHIISAGNMLVCGEDLGMVPDTVPEVMEKLNILSLEIQRMPKNPKVEFGHPNTAPYMSVCTTSTHDMSTIRGWWEENREKTSRFYNHILGKNGEPPLSAEPDICRDIILQHLHSPAMWTIFPIQDLFAIDGDLRWDKTNEERINIPSNQKNKWCYRMIVPLEDLCKASNFNTNLKNMVKHSGRLSDI